MEENKKLKIKTLLKCLENSYETKLESSISFWGLSNSLYNIKDFFKYNLISLNYKFNQNEKSFVHIYNKAYSIPNIEFMKQKLKSLILISYRNNYKPQTNSKNNSIYNSDCGWGCMIRSTQMIMARAIYKIFKYEIHKSDQKLDKNFLIKSVIYFFLDNNLKLLKNRKGKENTYFGMENYISKLKSYNENNIFKTKREICSIEPPFSIQKICIMGEIFGKTCGEWFSDYDLPKILDYINVGFNVFPNVKIIHNNSNLDICKLIESCFKEISKEKEVENYIIYNGKRYIFGKMGIIFISLRLGLESISDDYFPSIKKIFDCKEFLGFLGGKVQSASYFFGYVNDDLLFLDPHYNQTSVKDLEREGISSYIDKTIYKLSLKSLQTALTLGFLFRNFDEFIDLIDFCQKFCKDEYPIFYLSKINNLEINRKE